MRKIWFVAAVVVAGLAWFWLGRGGGASVAEGDPLGFVPDDTPYVFANLAPLPADVVTRSLRQVDSQIPQWRRQIAQALEAFDTLAAHDAADADDSDGADGQAVAPVESDETRLARRIGAWLRAFDAELAAAPDAATLLARAGFDPVSAKSAVYGLGLVPVVRVSLGDPEAFQALVARMEKASGETLPPVALPGVAAGWRIVFPEAPLEGVVAIADSHLVLTLAPAGDDAALRILLGLDRPQRSIADSGALQALNRREGFTAWGSGFVDTARLFAQFRTPATPLESAFLTALEMEKPMLPASCDADVARVAQAVPRLVAGYTRMDVQQMETLIRIETSPDLAKQLLTLRAPMPGLAGAKDALGTLGLALKVSALPALGNQWGSATTAAPWTCPALEWMNEAAAQARTGLNNPALYAAGPVVNSLLVALDRFSFDLATQQPSDLVARLVIGSDNPASLIATARSFVPQLAGLTLEPGAPPQVVPAELLMDTINQPMFVAMDKGALALAIGEGEDDHLPGYLRADNSSQPLFFLRYRGVLMGEVARLIREAAQSMPDATREELVSSAQMIEDVYVRHIEAMELSIGLSERGIELYQRVELKP